MKTANTANRVWDVRAGGRPLAAHTSFLTVCVLACVFLACASDALGQAGVPGGVPGIPGGIPTVDQPGVARSPMTGVVPSDAGTKPRPADASVAKAKLSEAAADRLRGVYVGRDPFWPVGFKPPVIPKKTTGSSVTVRPKSEWEQAEEIIQSRKTGTAKDRNKKPLILVNGQVARVGQKVTLDFRRQTYAWQVKSISVGEKGKITLDLERLGVR